MVKNKRLLALALASVMAVSTFSVPAGTVKAEEPTQEYVVMAENDAGCDKVEDSYTVIDEAQSDELNENNIMVVELTESEAAKLEKDGNIALVEEDIMFEGSDFEDETLEDVFGEGIGEEISLEEEREIKTFLKELRGTENTSVDPEEQWNIDVINANAKEYEQSEDRIKVAVLDTGVTATEDIDVVERVNFISGEEDVNPLYEDVSGHGTSVASVIAAKDNGIGVTGINPNVDLYSVKILDDEKKASLSGVIQGIYWCMEHDIDIINMSFGTSVESEILERVIKEADAQGILMIAAAGNKGAAAGESTVEYPAAFDEVIAVGATNPQGEASEISSLGEEIELMAPGETIPATGYFDEIIKTEGTSMAAPHVTGIASVLWAKDRTKSSRFIRELLNVSAKPMGEGTQEGSGLVDLDYALSVYDEFATAYTGNQAETPVVEENTEVIQTYTDAEVEASWGYSNHAAAVGLYDQTSASALEVMKKGAKIPDTESYLKYDSGVTAKFHGHGNYVASYIYVMRMARNCYNSGMSVALNTAHPVSESGKDQLLPGITTLNQNWSSVLSGYTINNANKARILVGIASHIAMDAYAHKAYRNSSGSWVKISDNSNQDDTTYVPNRWSTAKSVAYDIIDVWHFNMTPDALEFYQSGHDSSKFKLEKFKTNVQNADAETYNSEASWFNSRSYAD